MNGPSLDRQRRQWWWWSIDRLIDGYLIGAMLLQVFLHGHCRWVCWMKKEDKCLLLFFECTRTRMEQLIESFIMNVARFVHGCHAPPLDRAVTIQSMSYSNLAWVSVYLDWRRNYYLPLFCSIGLPFVNTDVTVEQGEHNHCTLLELGWTRLVFGWRDSRWPSHYCTCADHDQYDECFRGDAASGEWIDNKERPLINRESLSSCGWFTCGENIQAWPIERREGGGYWSCQWSMHEWLDSIEGILMNWIGFNRVSQTAQFTHTVTRTTSTMIPLRWWGAGGRKWWCVHGRRESARDKKVWRAPKAKKNEFADKFVCLCSCSQCTCEAIGCTLPSSMVNGHRWTSILCVPSWCDITGQTTESTENQQVLSKARRANKSTGTEAQNFCLLSQRSTSSSLWLETCTRWQNQEIGHFWSLDPAFKAVVAPILELSWEQGSFARLWPVWRVGHRKPVGQFVCVCSVCFRIVCVCVFVKFISGSIGEMRAQAWSWWCWRRQGFAWPIYTVDNRTALDAHTHSQAPNPVQLFITLFRIHWLAGQQAILMTGVLWYNIKELIQDSKHLLCGWMTNASTPTTCS